MKFVRGLMLVAFISFLAVALMANSHLEERHDSWGGDAGSGTSQKAPHNITQDICYNDLTTPCD